MEVVETIYKGFLELFHQKLPDHMLTLLVISGKIEENPPHQNITTIWVNSLTSASKGMYIVQGTDNNYPSQFMYLVICQMNVRF